jgi:hypothetical protein
VVGLNGDLPQFTIQKERTDLTLDERGIMNSDTTGLVFSEFKDMLSYGRSPWTKSAFHN